MKRLLVIGGASLDVLHLADRTVASAGGAGMYTAMAARRCGAHTTLLGPRPVPCPELLQPVERLLAEWLGPEIPPHDLPRFEISYRQGRTEYLKASIDAEARLSADVLPPDLSNYDLIHVTPLGDTANQLSMIRACRQRGARQISAGTYPGAAARQAQVVREVMNESDCTFMNDVEAQALFGSLEAAVTAPGRLLYVTLGDQGACVVQGETRTVIPAVSTTVLDPTGAGDTFCGATLAHLLQNEHPIMAARHAVPLAAEMIRQVGPAALLSDDPPPEAPLDPRVHVDEEQVRSVAAMMSGLSEVAPFAFDTPQYPAAGHPQALDYFFGATLQQFSFWTERNGRYDLPMIAPLGGVQRKGSDYLWEAFRRHLERDPDFCSPERQAKMSQEELLEVLRADDGEDPMPALDLHLAQARDYGQDMLALHSTPQTVVEQALASARPLETFLVTLDQVGGYKEDPLRKKSSLLAMILDARPEGFLPLRDHEQVPPVIDYHALRSCLRIGLVEVLDGELEQKLRKRQIVSAAEEWAVRYAAYRAIGQLTALSGKSACAVDQFLFNNARRLCLEMSEPQCPSCSLDAVCAQRKELFQPVLRTTFY